jgi:amidase
MEAAVDEMRTWDAVETAARIAAGDVTALEVIAASVARSVEADPIIAAVAAPLYASARASADHPVPGLLSGVPTAVKDMFAIEGAPLTHGSRAWRGNRATYTDLPAAQHLGTGLVPIAMSTMSEMGFTPTTEPLGRPPTRNPWNQAHSSGGSSGGSAALVAAGVVPIAMAADGGGSIRIPAAACGLVGLKPSKGRMAPYGEAERLPIPVVAHGVVARSVRDVAAYHAAAEAHTPSPMGLEPIGHVTGPAAARRRIGVTVEAPNSAPVDREIVAATRRTAELLAAAGHEVVELALPDPGSFAEDFTDYFGVLAMTTPVLGRKDLGRSFAPELLDPWTRSMGARGRRAVHRLPLVIHRLRAVARRYEALFDDIDVMLTPTLTQTAPVLGHLDVTLPHAVHLERLQQWMAFAPLHNAAGTPAISVPAGLSGAGLPIGVQLQGVIGDERMLLQLAYELEATAPWQQLAPVLVPLTPR